MAGLLQHSPSRLIQEFLVLEGYGTDPENDYDEINDAYGEWPVFRGREGDRPDDLIRVSDTQGTMDGTDQVSSEECIHHGIQVMVRSADYDEGYRKANRIAVALDRIQYYPIELAGEPYPTGSGSEVFLYRIQSVKRTTDVIPVGPVDTPQGKRLLFSINAIGTFRMCQDPNV